MTSYGVKKCNFCGEEIAYNSKRCPYCGSSVEEEIKVNGETTVENVNTEAGLNADIVSQQTLPGSSAPNYVQRPPQNSYKAPVHRNSIGNGLKVFLTVICTIIPGLGQLAGIILGIVFMNMDEDEDRKSFGVALLIASIILFVITCLLCCILVIAISYSDSY